MIDALFLSPHPDDAELFCGATIAGLVSRGHAVRVADLSAGEMASNGTPEQRREESLAAAAALGLPADRPVLGLPDGGIDANDAGQLRAVVELLREWRPRLLVAPWPRDRHPDHVAAGELARRAHFFAGVGGYAAAGEPSRPQRLLFYPCHEPGREPDLLVDATGHMDAWRAAVACYHSQFAAGDGDRPTPINDPGFLPAHEGRRAAWGRQAGCAFAEGFLADGPWRQDDLLAWGVGHGG